MPNACGVEQKGIKNVLVYVCAFVIYGEITIGESTYLKHIKNIVRTLCF